MAKNKPVEGKIIADLNQLGIGEEIVIEGRGGWRIKLKKAQEGFDLIHFNPIKDDENQMKFFRYTTEGNAYGAGMIDQEPTLGVQCVACGVDVPGLINGALVMNKEGKIVERYSWSNLVLVQNKNFIITVEGELKINGESKGFLQALFLADKNRIKGHVGVFAPEKPKEKVKVLEMESLLLKCLM